MAGNENIECCDRRLEFILQKGEDWQGYVPETATCGVCDTSFEKMVGNEHAYKLVEDENGLHYECTECGELIMAIDMAHSKWITSFGGLGNCERETIPYCPNCETKPEYNGNPIMPKNKSVMSLFG
ncbi:MAG: hypothetical protein GQ477_05030 [Nanohaloarchaea archaeon]|nr:hypothetical protein [Candidatus Nanohaloarchaea archaeon]